MLSLRSRPDPPPGPWASPRPHHAIPATYPFAGRRDHDLRAEATELSDGDGAAHLSWLLVLATVALVVLLVAWWVFVAVAIVGAVLSWLWKRWRYGPGEPGYAWKRRLAPLWHYPFIGVGSLAASLGGAAAVHEIVRGANSGLPSLVLLCVLARSLSMAWFPWPRAPLVGLRVFPLVAITGPLSSLLGMLAVWVLVLGGQMLGQPHNRWLAMTLVPVAISVTLFATLIGRLGRTLVLGSRRSRLGIDKLPSPDAIERGKRLVLSQDPLSERGACARWRRQG